MSDSVEIRACAKLNLRLRVFPVRPDGYHDVESLMVVLPGLSDDVVVRRAEARRVICAGIEEELAERDNLAWRALDALGRALGEPVPPLEVLIRKRIPVQAGLGGGSSDAAATLSAADRLLGLGLGPERLERVAAEVGSDVPFFVRGGCQWASGRGEILRPGTCPAFTAGIVVPRATLSTRAVYRVFDRIGGARHSSSAPPPRSATGLAGWVGNDLWPAALALEPGLGRLARSLRASGARAALLCGSGSAVAGVFADHEAGQRAVLALGDGARAAALVRVPAAG